MKAFIYYSEANKEVIAVIANDSKEAANKVSEMVKTYIIKDDFVLRTTAFDNVAGSFIIY
jgi:hypothetical protein